MTSPRFVFRPLETDDLPRLAEWLARPHVAEWWGAPGALDEVRREYGEAITSEVVRPFVTMLDGVPVGFVQVYDVMRADPSWWQDERDPGARGIDQFLADASLLGRGLGSRMLAEIVAHIFADPTVTKVQADPSPANARAIRAYEKAGFRRAGRVTTPDGEAELMVIRRAE
jgi:RimJ/RimL family protein N-acetyltransferase